MSVQMSNVAVVEPYKKVQNAASSLRFIVLSLYTEFTPLLTFSYFGARSFEILRAHVIFT